MSSIVDYLVRYSDCTDEGDCQVVEDKEEALKRGNEIELGENDVIVVEERTQKFSTRHEPAKHKVLLFRGNERVAREVLEWL